MLKHWQSFGTETSVTEAEDSSTDRFSETQSVEASFLPFGNGRTSRPTVIQVYRTNSGSNDDDFDLVEQPRKPKKKKSLSVCFSTVQCREYKRVLGDNPSVKRGVPLTFAWKFECETTQSVEDYELERASRPRLTREQLELKADIRYDMAKAMGYSRHEILAVVKQVNIAKYRRLRTLETASLHPVQEVLQGMKRGMVNATVRRSEKQKERELLQLLRQQDSSVCIRPCVPPPPPALPLNVKVSSTALKRRSKKFRSLGEYQLLVHSS